MQAILKMKWTDIEDMSDEEFNMICSGDSDSDESWVTIKKIKKTEKTEKTEKKDKYIECKKCKKVFVFDIYKQAKYRSLNWDQPKTCMNCKYN